MKSIINIKSIITALLCFAFFLSYHLFLNNENILYCVKNSLLITIILLAALVFLKSFMKNKKVTSLFNVINETLKHKKYALVIVILLLLTIACFLYFDYLFGEKLFIFNDIASDSFLQNLPAMMNNSLKLDMYGRIPLWDFSMFLGYPTGGINILDSLPAYFDIDLMLKTLGSYHVIKLVLSGTFFFLYLRKLDRSVYASILGSLGYAFSGYMILRSSWASYAADCLVVAFLLWGMECFLRNRKIGVLSISLMLLFYSRSLVFVVVYSGILLVYLVFRCVTMEDLSLKEIWKLILYYILIFLGCSLIVNKILVSNVNNLLSSSRVGNVEIRTDSLQYISDLKTILVSYYKTFANDIFGNVMNYNGSYNVLEDPTFYCGLPVIILIPYAFKNATKKQKIWYGLGILVAIAYCICLPLRLLMNGLAKDTFKLSSLWIIVLLLFLGTLGFDNFKHSSSVKPLKTYITLILFSIVILPFMSEGVSIKVLYRIIIFVIVYYFILKSILMRKETHYILSMLIIVVFGIEICANSYEDINDRNSASLDDVKEYYSQDLEGILEKIRVDDNGLYRIDYPTENLCTQTALHFAGTRGYIGGTGLNKDINEFLSAIGNSNTKDLGFTRYFFGFTGNYKINSLLGTKYMVLNENAWPLGTVPFGYVEVKDESPYHVFENMYALPMIYTYDQLITKEEFYKLSDYEKRQVMLEQLVNDDETTNMPISNEGQKVGLNEIQSFVFENEALPILIEDESYPYYILSFDVDMQATKTGNMLITVGWGDGAEENYKNQISMGSESIEIIIKNTNQKQLNLFVNNNAVVNNVKISGINDDYFEPYIESVEKRKKDIFSVSKFEEDIIEGSIHIDASKYIYFNIPYDANWHLYIDDEETDLKKGNIAFMYADINAGEHDIKLVYKKSDDANILLISIGSCLLLWVGVSLIKKEKNQHL